MKTDTPRPILLKDYRPSSYLIDTVNLDVSLHPTRTRVRSRLSMRANPSVAKPGALKLDGELLELESVSGRRTETRAGRVQDDRQGTHHRAASQG